MFSKFIKLSFALFFYVSQSSCSLVLNEYDPDYCSVSSVESEIDFSENDSLARYYFLLSERLLRKEQLDDSMSLLEKANELTEKPSPTLLRRLTQLYLKSGELEKALETTNILLEIDDSSIDDLQLKAGTLGVMGRTKESVETYKKILENLEDPLEEPYLLLAGMLIQQGNKKEGLNILNELLEKIPDSFLGSYYLGKLYASSNDFNNSIKYYEKALQLNPMADNVTLEYIQILAIDRQFDKAIKVTEDLLERRPDNQKARKFLTELLLGEDKIEEAIREYEKTKNLDGDTGDLQFRVALIKLQKRDYRAAESELNLLLTKDPTHHKGRYYLATTYAAQGRIEEAIIQLKMIPDTEELIYHKARTLGTLLYHKQEKYDKALTFINKAISVYPDNIELLSFKSAILKSKGETDKVLEVQKHIYSLQPESDTHLFNLGVAFDEAGNRDKALEKMEELIERNPNHANALNYLGYSLSEEGRDLDKALALIERAIEIEPSNGYFIDSLGWVFFQMEQYEKALPHLERANDLVSEDPVIMDHLGRVYYKLGKTNKAIEILDRVYNLIENDPSQKNLKNEVKELLDKLNKSND